MKERLLAELDVRIARHADGDSSGVLDDQAIAMVVELTASGSPDAGSLIRVAALHLCRYQALPPEAGAEDLRLARALYTKLHAVDPRLVSRRVREFFCLASPHDRGIALMREYDRTGQDGHLDRAISLFRQEVLEQQEADPADGQHSLGMALLRRFERTGQLADLDEAITHGRAAMAAPPPDHPLRAERTTWISRALQLRSEHPGRP